MSNGLVDHALELLAVLGAARARRMFGGHGLYVDDIFIALIADDRLYLKADEQTRPRFQAAGSEPFVYTRRTDGNPGDHIALGYWTVPPEAMESPALMLPWARLALEAALRARAEKPAARPRTPARKSAAAGRQARGAAQPSKPVARAPAPAGRSKPAAQPASRRKAAGRREG
jgi:DNA transformation protein